MEETKPDYASLSPEARVEIGMGLLDKVFGPEWALLIDLDTFNISDGNRCVLGQIAHATNGRITDKQREISGRRDDTEDYWLMLPALADLNGKIQDFLFEHVYWEPHQVGMSSVINNAGGFTGDPRTQDPWEKAIKARQQELGGARAVRRARRVLAQRRAKLVKASD